MPRTSPNDLQSWDDAVDLDRLVIDKRSGKRATPAKARRRNRRYQRRLLDAQLENWSGLEHLEPTDLEPTDDELELG
jgi:hypothetical protein